jgi:acylphosphatase
MGELLRKMFRGNYDNTSDGQIEAVAEGALLMQEQLARDVISLAEEAGLEKADQRVVRAVEIFERLR